MSCRGCGERVLCPETGSTLEKDEYWLFQVDPAWAAMVDDFIATNALQPSRDDITDSADNQYWAEFKDGELRRKFAEFHAPLINLVAKRVNTRDRAA